MGRNDRELRSSPAILCKIAVAVMVNISRPPITCLHLPPWKCTRQLPVENSSQGWIHHLPPLCPQAISTTPFSNNTSKTDTVYQTHLCQ